MKLRTVISVVTLFASSFFQAAIADVLPAALPQATVNTSLPAGWDDPADATPANGAELVQALENAVQDSGTYVIELVVGLTYTGNFVVNKKPGTDWLIIRTAGWESSPPVAEGVRVTAVDAPSMAKLSSPNKHVTFRAGLGAHHIRFIGIEFVVNVPSVLLVIAGYDDLIHDPKVDSEFAHHIGFDRVYIHSTSDVNKSRVGILLSANHAFVINSRIENIKDRADAQAVLVYTSRGPIHIENNFLEATGENIMIGGADTSIDQLVPSDITILRNHMTKRLEWNAHHPSYSGVDWDIKNLFELKNARRVLLQSNILENNWLDKQTGYAILLTPRNQDGGNPWAEVKDVTIENNIIRNTGRLFNLLGEDYLQPSETCERVTIRNNLSYSHGGSHWGVTGRILDVSTEDRPVKDLRFENNTMVFTEGELGQNAIGISATGVVTVERFDFVNNVFDHGQYGFDSNLGNEITNHQVRGNGFFFHPDANNYDQFVDDPEFFDSRYPGNLKANTIDDAGFTDHANLDYTLTKDSQFKNRGVNFKTLELAIAGVVDGTPGPDPGPDPMPPTSSVEELIAELKLIDVSTLTEDERDSLFFVVNALSRDILEK